MQPSILYLVLQEKSWKSSKALHFHIKVNLKSCINLQHSLKCGSNVDLKKYQKNWVLELQLNHQFVITPSPTRTWFFATTFTPQKKSRSRRKSEEWVELRLGRNLLQSRTLFGVHNLRTFNPQYSSQQLVRWCSWEFWENNNCFHLEQRVQIGHNRGVKKFLELLGA